MQNDQIVSMTVGEIDSWLLDKLGTLPKSKPYRYGKFMFQ